MASATKEKIKSLKIIRTDAIDQALCFMETIPNGGDICGGVGSEFTMTTAENHLQLKPGNRRITAASIYSADGINPAIIHSTNRLLKFGSVSISGGNNSVSDTDTGGDGGEARDRFDTTNTWDDNPFFAKRATFSSAHSGHRQSVAFNSNPNQSLYKRSNSIHVSKLSGPSVMSTYQLSTETALAFSRALNSKTAPNVGHRRTTIHRFMSTTASDLDSLVCFESKESWLTSLYTKLPKSKTFCRLQLKLLNLSVFDSVGRALEETANGDHAMLEHNSFLFALFNQFVPHDRIPINMLSKYVYRLHKYEILATIEFNLLKTPQSGQSTQSKSTCNNNGKFKSNNSNSNSNKVNHSHNSNNLNAKSQHQLKSTSLPTSRHRRSESISNTTTRHANKRENQPKNTNQKFVPFDYNRVTLKNDVSGGFVYGSTKFTPTSDYINASHVDSLLKPNAYIVAQGPNEATVGEFWQMIWQQNVQVILMLTKVYEFIRVMCVQYWPSTMNEPEIFSTASSSSSSSKVDPSSYSDGQHQYEVTLVSEDKLADYIVRTMKVRQIRPASNHQASSNSKHFKSSKKLTKLSTKSTNVMTSQNCGQRFPSLDEPGPSDADSVSTAAAAASLAASTALDDQSEEEGGSEDSDEDSGEYRTIYQLHFLSWNINSCPYSDSILKFRRRVQHYEQLCRTKAANSTMSIVVGPLLIHCSNGCGRSGTYACLDANLQLAEEEGVVDIFNFSKNLRKARANSIENLEQYKFIYETIEEWFVCGKTWFHLSEISQQMKQKAVKNKLTKRNEYQDEFEKLMSMTSKFSIGDCAGGHRLENRDKNRDVSIVPPDDFRPYLTSFQCNDQTDYINAVFVDGYTRPREYIVTEWPLKKTIPDIWSLIYDHDCNTVVVLGGVPDNNKSFPTFWPKDCPNTMKYGPTFSVDTISYNHPPQINSWVYRVQKKVTSLTELMAGIKAEPKITQVFEFLAWPADYKVPTSTNALVELIHMVERWRQRTSYGPVLVVSANGKSRVGVYCAANFAIEQVVAHEDIDIFNAVKTVRRHRSALIETIMEYKYCYDLTLHYVSHYLKKGNYNQIFKKQ